MLYDLLQSSKSTCDNHTVLFIFFHLLAFVPWCAYKFPLHLWMLCISMSKNHAWKRTSGNWLFLVNNIYYQILIDYMYSVARIYLNQNICVICVSPIRVYVYAYTHIRIYRYARMPHYYVWADLLFLVFLTGHCFLLQSKKEFSLFWIWVYSIHAYVFRLDLLLATWNVSSN